MDKFKELYIQLNKAKDIVDNILTDSELQLDRYQRKKLLDIDSELFEARAFLFPFTKLPK